MTLAEDGVRAVVVLHDDIAAWAARGDAGAWERFQAALAPDFVQVTPGGACRARAEVIAAVEALGGGYGDGFAIRIDNAAARSVGDVVVVTYREVQTGSPRAAADRIATALLARGEDGGLLWRHLHETTCG